MSKHTPPRPLHKVGKCLYDIQIPALPICVNWPFINPVRNIWPNFTDECPTWAEMEKK